MTTLTLEQLDELLKTYDKYGGPPPLKPNSFRALIAMAKRSLVYEEALEFYAKRYWASEGIYPSPIMAREALRRAQEC